MTSLGPRDAGSVGAAWTGCEVNPPVIGVVEVDNPPNALEIVGAEEIDGTLAGGIGSRGGTGGAGSSLEGKDGGAAVPVGCSGEPSSAISLSLVSSNNVKRFWDN